MCLKKRFGANLFVDHPGMCVSNINDQHVVWSGDGDSEEDIKIRLQDLPTNVDTIAVLMFQLKDTPFSEISPLRLIVPECDIDTPIDATGVDPAAQCLLVATVRRNPSMEIQQQRTGFNNFKKFSPMCVHQIALHCFKDRNGSVLAAPSSEDDWGAVANLQEVEAVEEDDNALPMLHTVMKEVYLTSWLVSFHFFSR